MVKPIPPSIEDTLTRAELGAPFTISDDDTEPLETPTRTPILTDGDVVVEIPWPGEFSYLPRDVTINDILGPGVVEKLYRSRE